MIYLHLHKIRTVIKRGFAEQSRLVTSACGPAAEGPRQEDQCTQRFKTSLSNIETPPQKAVGFFFYFLLNGSNITNKTVIYTYVCIQICVYICAIHIYMINII